MLEKYSDIPVHLYVCKIFIATCYIRVYVYICLLKLRCMLMIHVYV